MALLNYPILMAADILLYKAGLVPVGKDQEPHLEAAREIARRMSQDYGTDFPEPVSFKTEGDYVPSLTGEGKMSKSVEGSYINLTDDLETIQHRLSAAPTDSGQGKVEVVGDDQKSKRFVDQSGAESGGVANLLSLVELFEGEDKRNKYEADYQGAGIRYGELKQDLAAAIYGQLEPIQQKRRELEADSSYVDRVIAEGADKARQIAVETVEEVRQKMGLRQWQ